MSGLVMVRKVSGLETRVRARKKKNTKHPSARKNTRSGGKQTDTVPVQARAGLRGERKKVE